MADWEPHLGPLWHMLGGARTTNADKRKALTVGGAFFTDCIIPYVTNQDSLTTINRASVTRRGWWLGLLLDNMGYKLPGHADFDAEKNIEDLPVIDYTMDAANWRKTVAHWRDIVPELCDPIHTFLLFLAREPCSPTMPHVAFLVAQSSHIPCTGLAPSWALAHDWQHRRRFAAPSTP
jgi:hypothetical protein